MKKTALLSALLLTFASVFFLYVRASYIIAPGEMNRPLVVLWLLVLLFAIPAYWITRNWNWAGLILVVIVLGFFSPSIFTYAYSLTVVLILALLWISYRLLKRSFEFRHVFFVLNSVSLIAILLAAVVLVPRLQATPDSYTRDTREILASRKYIDIDQNIQTKPDIYYLVLDGYGRADVLQDLYGFDNSEFIEYLKEQGFIVPENSRSNYPKTVLSVSSTLNMDYIESFAPGLENSILWWLMSPWVDHNLVRTSLERFGYHSVAISTDWSITDNPTADYYLRSHPLILSDFERYFLGATPAKMLQPWFDNFSSAPTFAAHRQVQLNNFESLMTSTDIPGPKFVFAHVILPHPPFVFAGDGSPRTPRYEFSFNDASDYQETAGEYREQYVEQIQFLNSQLEPVIDFILQNSKQPPIIILQADHGPGMLTDFASAANTCLEERLSTFSAYYLPGKDPQIIPDDITPVNLFRIVFNEYFNTNLPVLDNTQYYPRQAVFLYDMEDVTASMDLGRNCSYK